MAMTASVTVGCGSQEPADTDHTDAVVPQVREITVRPESITPPPGILPLFTEIAQTAGIRFNRHDDIRGLHRHIEANGGGAALFDFDCDGQLDILLTNGCRLPRKERDESHSNQLFRGHGDDKYSPVTEDAGLIQHDYFFGCATGDFDNDGFDDLYVTSFDRNSLWHNNGDATFTEIAATSLPDPPRWSSSAAFADVNRDGILDLYVVNYLQASDDPVRLCPRRDSPDGYMQCPPTAFVAAADVLLIGDGAGEFRDGTIECGIDGVDGKGLGVVIFDANEDAWPEIYVANDGMPNFMYVNESSSQAVQSTDGPRFPVFRERAMLWGAAVNAKGAAESSMGIACGDYDADGRPDLFLTHFFGETNTIYRNVEGSMFLDESTRSRLGPSSRMVLGFGVGFVDCDNDGWLDLFVANGHVDDMTWAVDQEPYRMRPQLYRNERDGRFVEVSRWAGDYFQANWIGRGAAVGDLDNDGDMDVVVSHQLAHSAVLRNDTQTDHRSVVLRLIGRAPSNRSAIGAKIEASGLDMKLVRQIVGGDGYQSAHDRRVHIGLGKRQSVPRLDIQWPSGRRESWANVAAGAYTIVEGDSPAVHPLKD
jgi:hypothetical protein